MVFLPKMPFGISPALCRFSQAQEGYAVTLFSLACFAALHHLQDCETPGVEKDCVVPAWQGWVGGEASVAHLCP